jgi:NADH dehydrogenase
MILVAGATGTLGGRIVRKLLAQGKEVRILLRDPSPSAEMAPMGMATSAESLITAGAQAVTGDLTDRPSLDAACAGVKTVITTATSTKRDGNLEGVDLNGTLNLIDAAKQAGVAHFIYTSAYGSVLNHPNPLFHIKATCEQAVLDSGMTWTLILPGILPEVWVGMVVGIPLQAGQPVTLVGQGNHKHSFISEADVAAFAAAAVGNSHAKNKRIEIGGPSYSWTELVNAAGDVMGNPLPVTYVPLGSEVPLIPPMASGLLNAQETYESPIDMGDMPAQFGIELTPMTTVLQGMFGAR